MPANNENETTTVDIDWSKEEYTCITTAQVFRHPILLDGAKSMELKALVEWLEEQKNKGLPLNNPFTNTSIKNYTYSIEKKNFIDAQYKGNNRHKEYNKDEYLPKLEELLKTEQQNKQPQTPSTIHSSQVQSPRTQQSSRQYTQPGLPDPRSLLIPHHEQQPQHKSCCCAPFTLFNSAVGFGAGIFSAVLNGFTWSATAEQANNRGYNKGLKIGCEKGRTDAENGVIPSPWDFFRKNSDSKEDGAAAGIGLAFGSHMLLMLTLAYQGTKLMRSPSAKHKLYGAMFYVAALFLVMTYFFATDAVKSPKQPQNDSMEAGRHNGYIDGYTYAHENCNVTLAGEFKPEHITNPVSKFYLAGSTYLETFIISAAAIFAGALLNLLNHPPCRANQGASYRFGR